MNKPLVSLAVLGAALALSACETVTLAPAGAYAVGKESGVTLSRSWSDFTPISGLKKVRMLSIDGPLLNRLYLSEGLVTGDYIVQPANRREATTPVYDASMSVTEQVEFVANSVTALAYERVATSGVRPVQVNGQRGVRFDIEAATKEGLVIKGLGQAVKANDRLYVAIYLAPGEHYFAESRGAAEATMDSVTF
jgi:hypothetical protein